uniref:Uncharacterized protein n=1 Tax=Ditylenchus dipsaci TaxID=166011 RepID=A0A915CLW3_9BILA
MANFNVDPNWLRGVLVAAQENTVDRLFIRPHAAKSNQGNVKFDHKAGFSKISVESQKVRKISVDGTFKGATPLFAQPAIALLSNKLTATYGCLVISFRISRCNRFQPQNGSRSSHSSRPARII